MSQKIFNVADLGEVLVAKRRGAKYLRLSITAKGQVRVSIPYWTPYSAGVAFAKNRADWIASHQTAHKPQVLKHGDHIGKHHRLKIISKAGKTIATRVSESEVIVSVPPQIDIEQVQKAVTAAAERALKKQAQKLLPIRIDQLAGKYGYDFSDLQVKRLTSRWGSCSSSKKITLNYFLMQLPWELIDYVILHELVHTKQLNHGKNFWNELCRVCPKAKTYRKLIKDHKPIVLPTA